MDFEKRQHAWPLSLLVHTYIHIEYRPHGVVSLHESHAASVQCTFYLRLHTQHVAPFVLSCLYPLHDTVINVQRRWNLSVQILE